MKFNFRPSEKKCNFSILVAGTKKFPIIQVTDAALWKLPERPNPKSSNPKRLNAKRPNTENPNRPKGRILKKSNLVEHMK